MAGGRVLAARKILICIEKVLTKSGKRCGLDSFGCCSKGIPMRRVSRISLIFLLPQQQQPGQLRRVGRLQQKRRSGWLHVSSHQPEQNHACVRGGRSGNRVPTSPVEYAKRAAFSKLSTAQKRRSVVSHCSMNGKLSPGNVWNLVTRMWVASLTSSLGSTRRPAGNRTASGFPFSSRQSS